MNNIEKAKAQSYLIKEQKIAEDVELVKKYVLQVQ